MADFVPAEAFPPGEFLRDELNERGWTQEDFAKIIGRPQSFVSSVIRGKKSLSPEAAMLFSAALGTSAQFWMNLDTAYRLFLLSRTDSPPARIGVEARLRETFPVREMINRGWIEDSEDAEVLQSRVLRFYGLNSIDEKPSLDYAARKTDSETSLAQVQEAWLYRVKQVAEGTVAGPYSERRLRKSLETLENFRIDQEEIRHVPKVLAESGVRYVVVEPTSSSRIDGVCFWLTKNQPVIGMSLRIDRIDNFWFVLRHEIEHVLRGDGTAAMIVDSQLCDAPDDVDNRPEELAANMAAAEFCTPRVELENFLARVGTAVPEERVVLFAERIGVHPGLVVGQLHNRFQRYNFLRKYLVKVRNILVPNATTDGYGRQLLEAVE